MVKRQESKSTDYLRSHRQVPSLRRLALAAARFDLQEVGSIQHVKYAEEILATTLNERDAGQLAGTEVEVEEVREAKAKLVPAVLKIMKNNQTAAMSGYLFKDLHSLLENEGISLSTSAVKSTLKDSKYSFMIQRDKVIFTDFNEVTENEL